MLLCQTTPASAPFEELVFNHVTALLVALEAGTGLGIQLTILSSSWQPLCLSQCRTTLILNMREHLTLPVSQRSCWNMQLGHYQLSFLQLVLHPRRGVTRSEGAHTALCVSPELADDDLLCVHPVNYAFCTGTMH